MGFKNTLIGFWEIEKEPVRLGSLCIFISNVQAYAKLKDLCLAKFALIGSNAEVSRLTGIDNIETDLLLRHDLHDHWLGMLFDALGLDCIHIYESSEDFFSRHEHQVLFPSPEICEAANITGSLYDTTQITSLLCRESGKNPHADFNKNSAEVEHFTDTVLIGPVVALHLKNASKGDTESNANFSVWREFIESDEATRVRFLLIGSDRVPEEITSLPNVTSLNEQGLSIAEQLACIQNSSAFMGMASGPANSAILSKVPYIIFKHPLHHAEAMKKEIGDADHYDFSQENQKIVREYETTERLSAFLGNILK